MRSLQLVPRLMLISATAVMLAACPDPAPEEDWPPDAPPADPPVEEVRQVYEAQLQEVDGSGVTGSATIEVDGDEIRVTVMATGLNPDTEVPQHIHMNADCASPGGILLNLDSNLTVPGEGPPQGEDYPQTDGDGGLDYEAARSLDDLGSAAQEHGAPGVDELDLGNRVVNLHAADMRPVACGPLEPRG